MAARNIKDYTNVNELALAAKANKHNISALWLSVYKLIVFWAMRYIKRDGSSNRYELDDLTQSAYFALLKAIDDYTEDCGYNFSAFLFHHCRNEFREILGIRSSKREPVTYSLDAAASPDSDITLSDITPDTRAAAQLENVVESIYIEQLHNALDEVLQTLPEVNRQVIEMKFYEGLTIGEIAVALSLVDDAAVRRIERMAFRDLRQGREYAIIRSFDYYAQGIKHTGFTYFKYNFESSVEAAALEKISMEMRQKRILERRRE